MSGPDSHQRVGTAPSMVAASATGPRTEALGAAEAAVWWITLDKYDDKLLDLLNVAEHERFTKLSQRDDRLRFAIGAAWLRRSAARMLAVSPEQIVVDRRCSHCGAPHGKPRLPGTDLHASVTHSGALVGVALSTTGPIGLDVEWMGSIRDRRNLERLSRMIIGPGEWPAGTVTEILRYWTRKESVLKATGDGLMVDPSRVRVSGPYDEPILLAYKESRPAAQMCDLAPRQGYIGCMTVLTAHRVDIVQKQVGRVNGEVRDSFGSGHAVLVAGCLSGGNRAVR